MGTDPGTISNLRRLANAQVTDATWLSASIEACGLDTTKLTIDHWNKNFDIKEMGTVEKFYLLEDTGIKWNRPDDGMPMVITDKVPWHIILTRFLLFAGVIKGMQLNGEVTFAKVGGPPLNWNGLKVYFNDREMEKIIYADAILGVIEFYKKGSDGKPLTTEDGDSLVPVRLSGIVKIVDTGKPLTFF